MIIIRILQLAVAVISLFASIVTPLWADTIIASDDFQAISGLPINGRSLNNALGGTASAKWISDSNSIISAHPTNGSLVLKTGAGTDMTESLPLVNGQVYRMSLAFRPTLAGGQWSTLRIEGAPSTPTTRHLWTGPGINISFAPTWLQAGYWRPSGFSSLTPGVAYQADARDANGDLPITLIYTVSNRTSSSPIEVWIQINGEDLSHFAVTDMPPTKHGVAAIGAYGDCYVDNLVVAQTTPPATPPPTPQPTPGPISKTTASSAADYTYMWWAKGESDPGTVFNIQTNIYALSFNYAGFKLQDLVTLRKPVSERAALSQKNESVYQQGANVLFSDDFSSGAAGSSIIDQNLNNALGGSVAAKWAGGAGITYEMHTTSSQKACNDPYNFAVADYALDPAKKYRLDIKADPVEGFDGGAHVDYYSAIGLNRKTTDYSFWSPQGVMLRMHCGYSRNPRWDVIYQRKGSGIVTVTNGYFVAAEDIDSNGFYLVGAEFTGAGTASQPLQISVYGGNTLRGISSINDLDGGDRAGFGGGYGQMVDDFKLGEMDSAGVSLECMLESGSNQYKVVSAGPSITNAKLIESGKYFQRRSLEQLHYDSPAPVTESRLEVAAWPDRLAFIFYATPSTALTNAALNISLTLPRQFSLLLSKGGGKALVAVDGSGYALFKGEASAALTVDSATRRCTARVPVTSWAAGTEMKVTLVIYPAPDRAQEALDAASAMEDSPIQVSAVQMVPEWKNLKAIYDPAYGWHQVRLRTDGNAVEGTDAGNRRMERVFMTIRNTSDFMQQARLNFFKDGGVWGITGISPILRDANLNPTGIPVQLSKNWHAADVANRQRFEGPWYHAMTSLKVPPQSTLGIEYTSVYALWGGLPAASHSQLCLVGWGGNQLWHQAAIGSWGENICLNPESNSMLTDIRPLMVWQMNMDTPTKWSWTNNVGGGNFLLYVNESGQYMPNVRVRSMYRRYCPNLSEVSYGGTTSDGKMDMLCTVQLNRTDDITRGVFHMRFDARQQMRFSRLAFLQIGSEGYYSHAFNQLARGNENGMIEQWAPAQNGGYSRTGIPCTGTIPWFSLHEGVSQDTSASGAWANRGLVIRSWKARIGRQSVAPYAAVFGQANRAILEITPPPGVSQFEPGDYVEAEATLAIFPQFASDYYGPNTNLKAALAKWENSWEMALREAIGNDISVTMTKGALEGRYPIRIRADKGNGAQFTVTGGLAYVPLTIAGLSGYQDPVLERKQGSAWVKVDQTDTGKDYWQTDYEASDRTWEVTYNVPLDQPNDAKIPVEFRFNVAACPPTSVQEANWVSY